MIISKKSRRVQVPCPSCGTFITLPFDQVIKFKEFTCWACYDASEISGKCYEQVRRLNEGMIYLFPKEIWK